MFSAGYDIGDIPDDVFAERGREARRPPVHRGARRARGAATRRSSPRCPATRSAAGWRWRCAATCASPPRASSSACRRPSSASSTPTPACGASSRRSARRARASCSCSAATSTRGPRWPGASSTACADDVERRTAPRAGPRAGRQRAALGPRQQARRSASCSPPTSRLDEEVERELDRPARGVLRLRGHARGRPGVRREAPAALAGPLTPRRMTDLRRISAPGYGRTMRNRLLLAAAVTAGRPCRHPARLRQGAAPRQVRLHDRERRLRRQPPHPGRQPLQGRLVEDRASSGRRAASSGSPAARTRACTAASGTATDDGQRRDRADLDRERPHAHLLHPREARLASEHPPVAVHRALGEVAVGQPAPRLHALVVERAGERLGVPDDVRASGCRCAPAASGSGAARRRAGGGCP